jgi:hypothetical protein
MTFTHAIIPANTVVSNSADAKMPAKENNSLLGNSAAVVQQGKDLSLGYRGISARSCLNRFWTVLIFSSLIFPAFY